MYKDKKYSLEFKLFLSRLPKEVKENFFDKISSLYEEVYGHFVREKEIYEDLSKYDFNICFKYGGEYFPKSKSKSFDHEHTYSLGIKYVKYIW